MARGLGTRDKGVRHDGGGAQGYSIHGTYQCIAFTQTCQMLSSIPRPSQLTCQWWAPPPPPSSSFFVSMRMRYPRSISSRGSQLDVLVCRDAPICVFMNAQDVYFRRVVDSMVQSYSDGNTPNPDVLCNSRVKFGAFIDYMNEHGTRTRIASERTCMR